MVLKLGHFSLLLCGSYVLPWNKPEQRSLGFNIPTLKNAPTPGAEGMGLGIFGPESNCSASYANGRFKKLETIVECLKDAIVGADAQPAVLELS
jgi:hypothetical protein